MFKGLLAAIAVVATVAMPAAAQVTGKVTPADMPIAVPENTALLAPTLKHSVVVTGDVVRIGDLIDNAGVFASIPVFRAPDVGTTGSVPARKVIEAAHAHNLYGVDTGDVVQIEVTRTGRVIAKAEIEARVMRLFAGTNGLSTSGNLVLGFDREVASFYADLAPDADLRAMRAYYEPRSGRFDVVFEVPLGTSRRTLMRYTGSLVEAVDAVVPLRNIARGEVVRSADVIVERRSKADTSGDVVASLAEAVGRAARQGLHQGQPIRRADLMKPEFVKRDESVTLVYEVPGILLTTRGKALESGGEGDVVSVLNVQTKRTVQGVVTAPGRVDIAQAMSAAASAAIPHAESTGTQ